MDLFHQCRDGYGRIIWPDGNPLIDQPVKLTRAFNIIAATIAELEADR